MLVDGTEPIVTTGCKLQHNITDGQQNQNKERVLPDIYIRKREENLAKNSENRIQYDTILHL